MLVIGCSLEDGENSLGELLCGLKAMLIGMVEDGGE
jgi:hypothetical protein